MNNHHDKYRLLLFLYKELPEKEMQTTEAHLEECKTCRKEFNLMQETLNLYQELPLESPSPEILPNILAYKQDVVSFESKLKPLFEFFFTVRSRRWVIVPLCGILLAVSLVLLFKQSSRHQAVTDNTGSTLSIAQWQPPTDFLLISLGEPLLKTVPKLGESLMKINAIMPDKMN